MRRLVLSAVTIAAAGVLAACGNAPAPTAGPVQERTVAAVEGFRFAPADLTVTAGQPVRITFRNADMAIHDWAILDISTVNKVEQSAGGHPGGPSPKSSVHVSADAEKTGTVTFTPTQAGRYKIICSIPGHRELGMVGTFTVS